MSTNVQNLKNVSKNIYSHRALSSCSALLCDVAAHCTIAAQLPRLLTVICCSPLSQTDDILEVPSEPESTEPEPEPVFSFLCCNTKHLPLKWNAHQQPKSSRLGYNTESAVLSDTTKKKSSQASRIPTSSLFQQQLIIHLHTFCLIVYQGGGQSWGEVSGMLMWSKQSSSMPC